MDVVGSKTSYNLLTFRSPIIVEIENVGKVTMNSVLVPKHRNQYDEERLMGMDFMKKYTFVFGLFNNKYDVKIFPLVNNII